MDTLGINVNILMIQIVDILLFASWVFFLVYAITDMKKRNVSGSPLFLWILVLLLLPVLGGVLYWVTFRPSAEKQ